MKGTFLNPLLGDTIKVPFIDFLVAGGMTSVKEAEKGKVESTTDMHSATGVASAEVFMSPKRVKHLGYLGFGDTKSHLSGHFIEQILMVRTMSHIGHKHLSAAYCT